MPNLAERVGNRIRELREQHGLSQGELAESAETSQTTIWQIERGKTATNLALLERIERQLDVDPAELIKEAETAKIPQDILNALAGASATTFDAVRAAIEGTTVGQEKRALSGQGAQELGNPAQKAKRKRT